MNRRELTYMAVSGVQGINGSIHYVELDGTPFLLDMGLDVPSPEVILEKITKIPKLPLASFVSHAHMDHVGLLPDLVMQYPSMHLYMTYPTSVLAEHMLVHSLKLQQRLKREGLKQYEPSYSMEYLEMVFYLFQSFDYKHRFHIHRGHHPQLAFSFWDAGHILGSAGILIEWHNKKIFYSGNIRLSAQSILKGAVLPPAPVDLLILEATYGAEPDEEAVDYRREAGKLAEFISSRLAVNGVVVIPVFALGRTQELLMTISMLMKKSRIPVAPLYITGMGTRITKIYDRLMHKYDRSYPNIKLRPLAQHLSRQDKISGPAIVLATSGMMLPQTFSFDLAQKFMNDPKNGIAFVGFISPDSPGHALRQKEIDKYRVSDQLMLAGCRMKSFNFSAHSNGRELLKIIDTLKPEKIILFHGDENALSALRARIIDRYPRTEVLIPNEGEEYRLTI